MTGPMTWVDFAVIVVLLLSALLAMLRGFVREVLGIAAWAGAAEVAVAGEPVLRPTVAGMIADDNFVDPVTYAVLFLVALLVFLIVTNTLSGMVRGSAAGGLNRLLGFAFGVARGAAVLVVLYLVADQLLPAQLCPATVRDAQTLPLVARSATWALAEMPEQFRTKLGAAKPLCELPGGQTASGGSASGGTASGGQVQ